MAFRSKFQVPVVTSLKENSYQLYLLRSTASIPPLLKKNAKFFWFRKTKNEPIQHGSGNCGQPPPVCMDLVHKGSPSKCLESQKTKKYVKEKQPKVETVELKLTWWEKIFGPSPKRYWPDPCTCRLAYREKKKKRARDPRLCDPRYQMTAGDVLLYTEPIKQSRKPCLEPQPKPPPAYKIPKAALVRMISNLCDQPPIARMGLHEESSECKKGTRLKPFRIPYEEMRPPHRERKPFVCYKGVPPQDVFPPINRDLNLYQSFQKQSNQQCNLIRNFENFQKNQSKVCEDKSDWNEVSARHSRVQQLKILVSQKDMAKCITSFS